MALPNDKISIPMVARELGTTENDLGRLCIHPNINKWSKWKPVRYGSVVPITEAQLTFTNFGISLPIYDSVEDLVNALQFLPIPGNDSNLPIWHYLRPTGGASRPFRLTDFRNYKHNAVKPYGLFNVTPRASLDGGSPIIMGSLGRVMPSEGQLTLEDFDWGDRRLAMAYRKGASGAIETVVGSAGSQSVYLDVAQKSLTVGTYNAFLFLTNSGGSASQGILGLEGHPNGVQNNLLQFEVVTQTVIVNVDARFQELDPSKVSIKVTVDNRTGSPVNLTLCNIQIRDSMKACNDTRVEHEKGIFLGEVLAPAGNTIIYNESTEIYREAFGGWKVCWTNSGLYPNQYAVNILQMMD